MFTPRRKTKMPQKPYGYWSLRRTGSFFLVTTRMFRLGNASGNFIRNASNNSRDCCRARCQKIPRPRQQSRELLEALRIKLPEALPSRNIRVVTRKKLPDQRKSQYN